MRRVKSRLFTLVLILSYSTLLGQQRVERTFQPNFKYRASLGRIDSSRMYKIYLTPEILARCESRDLGDFRIRDKNNDFVAYVQSNMIFIPPYKVVFPKQNGKNKSDTYNWIFENSRNIVLDHIDFTIRNNSVSRNFTLTGSDDLQNWYAIADGEQVSRETYNDNHDGTFEHTIKFPSSNYRFFKLEQVDKKLKPISVLSGSIFVRPQPSKRYDTVSVRNISQKDSGNISVARIALRNKFGSNKLRLVFDGVKYYRRNIAIFENAYGERTQLFNGYISSDDKMPEIAFQSETNLIELLIYNEDNQPLRIKSATVLQLIPVIATYLEKGKEYNLLFGDQNVGSVGYDVSSLADSLLMQPMPEIVPKKIEANPLYKAEQVRNGLPSWIIWVAIAAVAIVLLTLTLKMTREVNKRSQT